MIIRTYQSMDGKSLAKLFYQTVHTVNAADYTDEQLDAWASGEMDLREWDRSLSEHITLVAVQDGCLIGFGDIDLTGYLDRLFVHREYQRQGIATALCDRLERSVDVNQIITHASITAKPFFLGRGYRVISENQVIRNGIALTNFIMEKCL